MAAGAAAAVVGVSGLRSTSRLNSPAQAGDSFLAGQKYQVVASQATSAAAPAAINPLRRRRNRLRRRVISPFQSYLEPYIVVLREKWPASGG
jgi:hypothetical protein